MPEQDNASNEAVDVKNVRMMAAIFGAVMSGALGVGGGALFVGPEINENQLHTLIQELSDDIKENHVEIDEKFLSIDALMRGYVLSIGKVSTRCAEARLSNAELKDTLNTLQELVGKIEGRLYTHINDDNRRFSYPVIRR